MSVSATWGVRRWNGSHSTGFKVQQAKGSMPTGNPQSSVLLCDGRSLRGVSPASLHGNARQIRKAIFSLEAIG